MNELEKVKPATEISVFSNTESFDHAQRIAKALCTSDIVPTIYRNNISNTLVALEMAQRIGASPLMVMQNLYIIQGKPSWSSSFIIAALNACGRFLPIKFRVEDLGEKTVKNTKIKDKRCIAYTKSKDGEELTGPEVSVEMAVLEGWYGKSSSKWPTMTDLMLNYRAAAFFGRLYAPDVMMGMHTREEVLDITYADAEDVSKIDELNKKVQRVEAEADPLAD